MASGLDFLLNGGSNSQLSDEDKQNLFRRGLLQAGLYAVANARQPGVSAGQALAGGLLSGVNSVDQGEQQMNQQRFQAQVQQDQLQQIQRRRGLQDLARNFVKPDGQFDMNGYQQALFQQDPQAAMELQQNQLKGQLLQAQTQKYQQDVKAKQTRQIENGSNLVTQEMQPDGSWQTIATAPRWQPQQADAGNSALNQRIRLLKAYGATDDDVKHMLGIQTAADQQQIQQAQAAGNGDAALSQLNPSDRSTVQAIVDGRYPVPTGKQAQSPEWQRLIQIANQVDPTLDAGTYGARAAARKNLTSGKGSNEIKALNTLAGHIQTLQDALDQLDNSNVAIVNRASNFIGKEFGGQRGQALSRWNQAANSVGGEAAKVFAGGNTALADRQEIAHSLDPGAPKENLQQTLATYAELVQSRLQAFQDQADQSLGYGSKGIQVVTPKAQKVFKKLAGQPVQSQIGASPSPTTGNGKSDPLGLGL